MGTRSGDLNFVSVYYATVFMLLRNLWNNRDLITYILQEVGVKDLTSKTQMKTVLRWMKERQKLKQICNHVGPNKQFLYTTWFNKPPTVTHPRSGGVKSSQHKAIWGVLCRLAASCFHVNLIMQNSFRHRFWHNKQVHGFLFHVTWFVVLFISKQWLQLEM